MWCYKYIVWLGDKMLVHWKSFIVFVPWCEDDAINLSSSASYGGSTALFKIFVYIFSTVKNVLYWTNTNFFACRYTVPYQNTHTYLQLFLSVRGFNLILPMLNLQWGSAANRLEQEKSLCVCVLYKPWRPRVIYEIFYLLYPPVFIILWHCFKKTARE